MDAEPATNPDPAGLLPGIAPGVHVRPGASDDLVAALAESLAGPSADPFRADVVSVPTQGIERWLAQHLAEHLGVCAAVRFPRLEWLVDDVAAGVLDLTEDPWGSASLVWPVLESLYEVAKGPDGQPLRHHLASEHTRRFVVAERMARRLRHYAVERPELVLAWSRGEDVDATGEPLDPVDRWQARLWRALVERIPVPDPAARLETVAAAVSADAAAVDLPERLAVFGVTRLPAAHRRILTALGVHRAVTLYLPHPSAGLWERIDELDPPPALPLRHDDATALVPENALLERLGRQSRELQLTVRSEGWEVIPPAAPHAVAGGTTEVDTTEVDTTEVSVLARLQAAVRQDAVPESLPGSSGDGSVRFHRCHGPDRQVEVLRETLLGLLADDPTLEPRDIIVQCPAIDDFAPLLQAAFAPPPDDAAQGSAGRHPGRFLPVRLADRSLRDANPVLQVVAQALEIAAGRATRSQLLDLCATPPVARRFGWTREGDLESLADLIDAAGVTWGVDAAFRERFKVRTSQTTWSGATDRLLLGLLREIDDEHTTHTAVPAENVDSSDGEMIGHLAELVDRVATLVAGCNEPAPPADWLDRCHRIIDLLTDVPPADAWQLGHAHGVLADLAAAAEVDGTDHDTATSPMRLGDVQALLADALAGRPTRSNFGTGAITMCTLTPMRSIPHRVVVLVGLDDGVFPRPGRADGDDLVARSPRVGDPDPRAADRQAFLDAVLAATETLVVIHSGQDPHTNLPIAPAPPVQDLLDACRLIVPDATLFRRHPLQPFGAADLTDPPFSFDRRALASARALQGTPEPTPVVFDPHARFGTPDPEAELTVDLDDLVTFFEHPVKHLLKQHGLQTFHPDEPNEQLPLDLDGLALSPITRRFLAGLLRGADPGHLMDVERRRGAVPPRELGAATLRRAMAKAERIAPLITRHTPGRPVAKPCRVTIGRFTLTGTIAPIHGDSFVDAAATSVTAKRRFSAWIRLLALTATDPGDWRAKVIGSWGSRTIGPVGEAFARARLNDLLVNHLAGQYRPVLWSVGAAGARIEPDEITRRDLEFAWDENWRPFAPLVWDLIRTDDFGPLTEQLFRPMTEYERELR